jgi:DNA repair protein RecN (Recombination protein N)
VITSLGLAGLGVIDSAELELGSGLTVLTGETGAGKTMVVTSLQLLLGGRASADLVRAGSDRARVAARFEVTSQHTVVDQVRDAGGEVDDDTLTAVRTVSAGGRSRAALGGAAVPVAMLVDVGADLVAIHGQHDQSRLALPARQLELLDRFGGLTGLAAEVATEFARLRDLRTEREQLVAERQERLREADLLTFGVGEVSTVAPKAGEDAELLAEEERLAYAVDLKQAAISVASQLSEDERSVSSHLAELQRALDAVRAHDVRLDAMASRLSEIGYLVADLASDLNAYNDSVEADPARLGEVQDRRAALTALQRKYGPQLADVLAWASQAEVRLLELSSTDDRLAALESEIAQSGATWSELATELSNGRVSAATTLSKHVTDELAALAMPDAELVVDVSPRVVEQGGEVGGTSDSSSRIVLATPGGRQVVAGASGFDDVAFLLKPHRGAPASPVQRGASGGELSRVMLAIEVVLADADPVPTVVFDEVDAGVGGSAAVEVGRRLSLLGRSRQVLVVTHLPQVAAFADRHWMVQKSTTGDVTASGVTELDEAARVKELTRMLAGLADSSSGQAHAEELLEVARQSR